MFLSLVFKSRQSFSVFSLTAVKISTLIATANNPYLALVSGGSQVLIVQHGEEADESSVIKMFLPGW